jgi:hypothetical protein
VTTPPDVRAAQLCDMLLADRNALGTVRKEISRLYDAQDRLQKALDAERAQHALDVNQLVENFERAQAGSSSSR